MRIVPYKELKAPNVLSNPEYGEYNRLNGGLSIFLAGGIEKAPNWQHAAVECIKTTSTKSGNNIIVFNPRCEERYDFFPQEQHDNQVAWEFSHLRRANVILFWFPENAPCTTSLYELGYWLGKASEKVYLGINPGHYKERCLRRQWSLLRGNRKLYSSLDEMIRAILSEKRRLV